MFYKGVKYVKDNHEMKKNALLKSGVGLYPGTLEKISGALCLLMLVLQIYLKIHSQTLIFIYNPCHTVTVSANTF